MKRVFFFGAGATKADFPQAPLNNDLLSEALKLRLTQAESAKAKVADFLNDFFHTCDGVALPRVEDILSFLDSNLLNQKYSCRGYGYEEFLKVRASLVYLIGQVFENTLKDNPIGVTKKFCDSLTGNDVIISTNHDIVVDNALRQERHNVNYGEWIRGGGSFSESYTLFGDEKTNIFFKNDEEIKDLNRGDVELLKIHGSLNFLYCPKCKEVDITVGQKGILYCMRKNFEVKCINQNCTGKYTDLIIVPTYYKIYNNTFLVETWRRAERAIASADEVIFIGYSMPDADVEIKCMLLRGIAKNKERPKIKVINFQDKDAEIRYLKLFGDIKYYDYGFEKYLSGDNIQV